MLIKYIREPKTFKANLVFVNGKPTAFVSEHGGTEPIGVIVAVDKNKVGWSMCNPKDKFNKYLGQEIAANRAEFYGTDQAQLLQDIPEDIREDILEMYNRSTRYFK